MLPRVSNYTKSAVSTSGEGRFGNPKALNASTRQDGHFGEIPTGFGLEMRKLCPFKDFPHKLEVANKCGKGGYSFKNIADLKTDVPQTRETVLQCIWMKICSATYLKEVGPRVVARFPNEWPLCGHFWKGPLFSLAGLEPWGGLP